MTAPTRVAVVGAGRWGEQHARAFAAHPAAELCAVVDRQPDRASARAARYGARAYDAVGTMLAAERPDLVSLCLPSTQQVEPTLDVVQAGVPLLVEKPLAFDPSDAALLVKEADRTGLFFAIDFNHRFAKTVAMARSAVESGRLGDLVFATWRFGGERSECPHPYANLVETQCHGFDLLEHLCGPIASVSAELTDVGARGRAWQSMAITLRFANDAVGCMAGTYDASYAHPGTQRLELNGTRGRVVIEDTVRRFSFQEHGSETAEVWQAGYFNDADRAFTQTVDAHVAALLEALREGRPPPVPAHAGYRALLLAHAAVEAWQTGRRVGVLPERAP